MDLVVIIVFLLIAAGFPAAVREEAKIRELTADMRRTEAEPTDQLTLF